MKALHFYSNIASQMPPTMIGLESIGVESRAIVFKKKTRVQEGSGLVNYLNFAHWSDRFYLIQSILWCDIIHWYYCINLNETSFKYKSLLFFIKLLRKKVIFEAWGSDIRNGRLALKDNEHLQNYVASKVPDVMHKVQSEKKSLATQRSIAAFGGKLMVPLSELIDYVDLSMFPKPYISRVRLDL